MKYFWILRKPPRNPTKSLNISWKVWEAEPKTLDIPRFQAAFAARVGEIMPGTLVNSFEHQKYFIVFSKVFEKFMKYLWKFYEIFMKNLWNIFEF